jgi:hypothetical protein
MAYIIIETGGIRKKVFFAFYIIIVKNYALDIKLYINKKENIKNALAASRRQFVNKWCTSRPNPRRAICMCIYSNIYTQRNNYAESNTVGLRWFS